MKKISFIAFCSLLLYVFTLSSCFNLNSCFKSYLNLSDLIRNDYGAYNYQNNSEATISISSLGYKEKAFYSPDEVSLLTSKHDLEDNYAYLTQRLNNLGDTNIVVIPINVPGYDRYATENNRQKIANVFFGDSTTTGWESVSSFYYKSSFGQLNIGGFVSDWYTPNPFLYPNALSINDEEDVINIMNDAIKELHLNDPNFDSDKDGFIDSVCLIYNAPVNLNENYWAYTFWDQDNLPNLNKPTANAFLWAGIDFINLAYDGRGDAHTFIHETGHLLGLNDYYDYATYNQTNPIGSVDMMDENIIDHNSYSKMILGWTKPYIVLGDCEITIKSFQHKNNFIVIPKDNTSFLKKGDEIIFNPFSEYILIEFYTPDGLNELDSKYFGYPGNNIKGFTNKGVRIYHVDSRMFLLNTNNSGYITSIEPYDEKIKDFNSFTENEFLIELITNTSSGERSNLNTYWSLGFSGYPNFPLDNNDNEIEIIHKDKKKNVVASNSSLFYDHDTFSINNYYAFFENDEFNSGGTTSAQVKINL